MVCRFPSSSFLVVLGEMELIDRYYCHRWSCGREGVVVIHYMDRLYKSLLYSHIPLASPDTFVVV